MVLKVPFEKPKTYWGFPVAKRDPLEPGVSEGAENGRRLKKRGVALLMAMFITAIMILFASDLIVTSQVNLELGVANRDNLKAEYMAKSGFTLALFLVSIDWAIDLFLASPQSPMKTPPTDGMGDIWGLLNGMPIGGETADLVGAMQDEFKLNALMDEKIISQLKLFDGVFTINVTDESKKINVNNCAQNRCSEVMIMLEALFSCPVEKAYLAARKTTPREIVYKLKDWIDRDDKASPESGITDESELYESREFPYKTKNAPLDSIEELRMIDGWDEDMHKIFSKYITAFPLQTANTDKLKININTADRSLLACLFPDSKANCGEKFALAMNTRDTDKEALGSGGDVSSILKDLLCYSKEGVDTSPDSGEDKTKWFSQTSNVYRIEAKGAVGKQEKTLEAVIERMMPDPAEKTELAYRILYWRLI